MANKLSRLIKQTKYYNNLPSNNHNETSALVIIQENIINNAKRLIRKAEDQLRVGDNVMFKRHPYDQSIYEVKELLPDGTVFIDNGINAYTNIKPSTLNLVP